jgi:hypothetical protein
MDFQPRFRIGLRISANGTFFFFGRKDTKKLRMIRKKTSNDSLEKLSAILLRASSLREKFPQFFLLLRIS